jgi:hypothetical protein
MRLEKLEGIDEGFTALRQSVADGWQRVGVSEWKPLDLKGRRHACAFAPRTCIAK